MVALLKEGKLAEARALHYRLLPLARAMFIEPNPAPLKAALELLGLPAGSPRLPILPVNDKSKAVIRQVLVDLGLNVRS
jgi:4-hydroxy-tetrahydrodipicolinate synthase